MIFIVVRQTTDWADEAKVRAQLPVGFAEAVDLWNATFEMPYHLFRVELKRIAEWSWSRVEGATCAPIEEVPGGAVILPTDDDDWFAPGIARAIEAGGVGRAGYRWPSRFLEVPTSFRHRLGRLRRRLFPGTNSHWLCTTNNYAVTRGRVPEDLVQSHMRASAWFSAHPDTVLGLPDPLSVMNRSLASQTTLRYGSRLSQAKLLRKHRSYRRIYRAPLENGLSWCAPYAGRMHALMDALRPRAAK